MNDFDQAARYAAKQFDCGGFIRWLVPNIDPTWIFDDWLDTQSVPFPGEGDLRCDTVAGFDHHTDQQSPMALIFEFQTKPDGIILERGCEYKLRLRREVLYQRSNPKVPYQFGLVVANLTGGPQSATWVMEIEGLPQFALRMDASVFTLRDMDASALLDRVEAGEVSWAVLAWMSLMRGADTKEFIDRWKLVADAKGDPAKLVNLAGLVRVFAELTNCQALWTNELKGWHVMKSKLVESWRQEGRVEESRAIIEEVIRNRFGSPVPPEIAQLLSHEEELVVLRRWHTEIATATSIDDLRERIAAL